MKVIHLHVERGEGPFPQHDPDLDKLMKGAQLWAGMLMVVASALAVVWSFFFWPGPTAIVVTCCLFSTLGLQLALAATEGVEP